MNRPIFCLLSSEIEDTCTYFLMTNIIWNHFSVKMSVDVGASSKSSAKSAGDKLSQNSDAPTDEASLKLRQNRNVKKAFKKVKKQRRRAGWLILLTLESILINFSPISAYKLLSHHPYIKIVFRLMNI